MSNVPANVGLPTELLILELRRLHRQTDRQTDGRTDGRTDVQAGVV